MLRCMSKSAGKGLNIAYIVVAVLTAALMFLSASFKLMVHPDAVKVIHGTIGLPIGTLVPLAMCEIAGGLGLLAGIFRPKLGVAAGVGLVIYFVGAFIAHIAVGDWAGVKSPIMPFVLSCAVLLLRVLSMRRA